MKEKIKYIFWYNLENFILQHMTFVVVFIIWVIWILFWAWNLWIEYVLTSTWAIIAFWYWYKKYERDKELHLFFQFNKKSDEIIDKKNFKDLLLVTYEENYLNLRGYISKALYKERLDRISSQFRWLILNELFKNHLFENRFKTILNSYKINGETLTINLDWIEEILKELSEDKLNDDTFLFFYISLRNSNEDFVKFKLKILDNIVKSFEDKLYLIDKLIKKSKNKNNLDYFSIKILITVRLKVFLELSDYIKRRLEENIYIT